MHTYLLAAHDQWRLSRVNRRLREAAQAMEGVTVCDLYAEYPDYCVDVTREQARLQAAQRVVLMHPIHWYSMPALQKLWLDDVLTHGWAYGGGQALHGKEFWLVTTTGGDAAAYTPSGLHQHVFEAFLPPYRQTAALCGMHFLPPLVLHGAHRVDEAAVQAHVQRFAQQLQAPAASWAGLSSI